MIAELWLHRITGYAVFALLGGFATVIAIRLIRGDISLDGLLDHFDAEGNRSFSAARLQMLMISLVVAGRYLHDVWVSPQRGALPGFPREWVITLAGSQGLYLMAKAYSTIVDPVLKTLQRR